MHADAVDDFYDPPRICAPVDDQSRICAPVDEIFPVLFVGVWLILYKIAHHSLLVDPIRQSTRHQIFLSSVHIIQFKGATTKIVIALQAG